MKLAPIAKKKPEENAPGQGTSTLSGDQVQVAHEGFATAFLLCSKAVDGRFDLGIARPVRRPQRTVDG
jgi:hypothetical protein